MIRQNKPNQPAIRLTDLSIGYQTDTFLIHNINVSIEHGELVALVGRNGTGKSTLIKTLAGLFLPLSGKILLDNKAFNELNSPQRARTISYVAASVPDIPDVNVYELVSLGRYPFTNWMGALTDQDRQIISSVLHWVGMQGYDNKMFHQLSDGEKQRVMIARALAQDTPVIFLDEPTAFLDLPNKFDLIRLLSKLKNNGRTILFSTHDIETAWLWADKLWVIHNRSLIEGAPEDLGLQGVYDELFRDSGVFFNSMSQHFETRRETVRSVFIEPADSEIYRWTSRAFNRAGIGLADIKGSADEVIIPEKNDETGWMLKNSPEGLKFQRLYDLINYLIRK